MNVCENCHDKIHNGNINVNGYIQTSDGIELDISKKTTEKISDELLSKIKSYHIEMKLSISKIREKLKLEGFEFSIYKIKKLLQN
jgi:hypothetical protein